MKERLTAIFLFLLALVTVWAVIKKQPVEHYGIIPDAKTRDAESVSASSPAVAEEVIRLHILADSDTASDQSIKLAIRDELLPYLSAITERAADKEDALTLLAGQCDTLTQIANRKLCSLGADYSAKVSLTKLWFPIRIYGSRTYLSEDVTLFPPGMYDSIQVVLGEGIGHNWWCLAYPSLCFIDATYDYVPKSTLRYRDKFSTVKESSLYRLFYGSASPSDPKTPDREVNLYLESKIWNLLSTKFKKFMIH